MTMNHDSGDKVNSSTSSLANGAKSLLSGAFSVGKVIGTSFSKKLIPFIAGFIILMLVPLLIVSALPMNTLGLNSNEFKDSKTKLQEAIKGAYADATMAKKFRDSVEKTFAKEPFNCDGHEWILSAEDFHKDYENPSESEVYFDTVRNQSLLFFQKKNFGGCYIKLSFEPDIETMMNNMTAYVTAVNGAIDLYSDEETEENGEGEEGYDFKFKTPEGNVITEGEVDENNNVVNSGEYTEAGKDLLEFEGEDAEAYKPYTDAASDEFAKDVGAHAERYFFADRKAYRWEGMPEYNKETETFADIETIDYGDVEVASVDELKAIIDLSGPMRREIRHHKGTETKYMCISTEDDPQHEASYSYVEEGACTEPNILNKNDSKEEPYNFDSNIVVGEVTVSMFYTLQHYKENEINDTITKMEGKGRCAYKGVAGFTEDGSETCTVDEASQVMWATITEYYNNYAGAVN